MTAPYRTPGERDIPAKKREWPWSKWSPRTRKWRAIFLAVLVPNVVVWALAAFGPLHDKHVGAGFVYAFVLVLSSLIWGELGDL